MWRWLAAAALLGCAGRSPVSASVAPRPAWSAPPVAHAVSVRDVAGERLDWAVAVERLAGADVVFVGETHLDETTHRVERALLEALAERRTVVLSLEMLERDIQSSVDSWLAGQLDDGAFLDAIRPWSNHATAYQPLLDVAKARGLPVVAANFPRPWLRRVGTPDAPFEDFTEAERALLPRQLLPNSPAYWARADNAMRGHAGRMPAPTEEGRLTSVQSLWDNAMGEAVVDALDANPGALVVHVVGGFHTAYGDGTAAQVRQRRPEVGVQSVGIIPTVSPSTAEVIGRPSADLTVFAEARASDVDQGRHAVTVSRELGYRLHVPDVVGAPLLIWLPDDGLTAADGLALWRDRLGDEVAIASLEPPYRALQPDGAEGGRWSWPDSFAGDIGVAIESVERVWGYLLRTHDLDPSRVVIAGEGAGATVAAMVTLRTSRMAHRGVALGPTGARPVRDLPLPLPDSWGEDVPPARTLSVVSSADLWASEAEAYAGVGLPTELVVPAEGWDAERQAEDLLREALGLEPAPEVEGRVHVVLADADPRAEFWARLVALRHGRAAAVLGPDELADGSMPISLEVTAERAGRAGFVPRCPGPFGGTTVVVLGESSDRAAWMAVAEADPLAAKSRFHRMVLVDPDAGPSLSEVLAQLEERGRTNVLVVPAVFHGEIQALAALRQEAAAFAERMTVTFRPGLGDRIRGD